MKRKLPRAFLKRLQDVKGKRSRVVVDHILAHGHITTEDLKEKYEYDHPPRAVQDVKDQGIPIEKFEVVGKHGRRIAAYRFGDPKDLRGRRHAGRRPLSKAFKASLVAKYGSRCGICSCSYEPRYLQMDHRVPYEVAGDVKSDLNPDDFMLICAPCNRAKSWSCEHCANWTTDRDAKVCKICYWGDPEKHVHIALRLVRRLDLVWTEEEVPDYDKLLRMSREAELELPGFVKDILRKSVCRK